MKANWIEVDYMYDRRVPKLWNQTIEEHRRDVRAAILDASWELVDEQGLTSVTMSEVAEKAGIGRATLYKYFPDIESMLLAWHERHITHHLDQLERVRDHTDDAGDRLEAVLTEYATIASRRGLHAADLVALLHRDQHAVTAHQQLVQMIRNLLVEAAESGVVRTDITADELVQYCVHALSAASTLPSEAAVLRLVAITLSGLRGGADLRAV